MPCSLGAGVCETPVPVRCMPIRMFCCFGMMKANIRYPFLGRSWPSGWLAGQAGPQRELQVERCADAGPQAGAGCIFAKRATDPGGGGTTCADHVAVGQNQWYGDWDVQWGYGFLTHGQVAVGLTVSPCEHGWDMLRF